MKPIFWNKGKTYLSKNDKVLKLIIQEFNNEYLSINKNYYHCLLNSIIGQQISVAAASSIKKKFFSLKSNINPISVLKLDKKKMKTSGLSSQKISYIINLSEFFLSNKKFVNNINFYRETVIKEKLINIKGIGPWTIDMFLIFSLGKSNIFPVGDLGLRKAISKSYSNYNKVSERKLNLLYNKWTPYNTVATWYLWRSIDPKPINY